MLSADDIDAMIDEDMPGYVLASFNGADLPGLFRNGSDEAIGIGGGAPVLVVAGNKSTALEQGSALVIDGTNYTVFTIKTDVSGIMKLVLEKS